MPPEWTYIRICLMIALAVRTLEGVRAQIALYSLQLRRIRLFVSLVAPCKFSVMFQLVRAIAFDTLGFLNAA